MRKGTFSVKKAGSNSAAHNSRENAPKYLIGLEDNSKNYYELIQSDKDFILEAQNIYKEKIGQSMQKRQIPNLVQETVLTLKKYQDENTVKNLFEKLHEKYGGHTLLEVSVHRDEGHFEKDGIAYYPTKNILKKNDAWYIQSDPNSKEFDIKVDISEFNKVYNYHAHAKFSMFDKELGKTARMQKKDMSERIKFVSDELGLKYAPNEATRNISKPVHQVKDEHHAKAKVQQELSYDYRTMQKRITALKTLTSEQKKELHSLNSSVKNDRGTIEQLNLKIQELTEHKKTLISTVKEALKPEQLETLKQLEPLPAFIKSKEFVRANILGFKNQAISALERTKPLQEENETLKERLDVLKQDMIVLRANNDERELIIGKKVKTIQSHNNNQKRVEELLPTVKGVEFNRDTNTVWYARLAEFVKGLSDKIKSLTKENEQLRKENQEYKELVSNKVKSLGQSRDYDLSR